MVLYDCLSPVCSPGQAKEKVPVTISEVEFVRRWSLHILPKGFTRVRHYGMSANRHRKAYLKKCCELRGINDEPSSAASDVPAQDQVQDQVQDGVQDGVQVQDGVVHVQVQERVGQDEVVQPQNGAEQVDAIQRRDRCDVDGDDVGLRDSIALLSQVRARDAVHRILRSAELAGDDEQQVPAGVVHMTIHHQTDNLNRQSRPKQSLSSRLSRPAAPCSIKTAKTIECGGPNTLSSAQNGQTESISRSSFRKPAFQTPILIAV